MQLSPVTPDSVSIAHAATDDDAAAAEAEGGAQVEDEEHQREVVKLGADVKVLNCSPSR